MYQRHAIQGHAVLGIVKASSQYASLIACKHVAETGCHDSI